MSDTIQRIPAAQLKEARKRALRRLKVEYDAQRRQVLAEFKAAMIENGYIAAKVKK